MSAYANSTQVSIGHKIPGRTIPVINEHTDHHTKSIMFKSPNYRKSQPHTVVWLQKITETQLKTRVHVH